MTEFSPEWQAEEQARRDRMAASGLYRAEDEHSSCGVGFVVDLDGKPSRKVVQHGIDGSTHSTHTQILQAAFHRHRLGRDKAEDRLVLAEYLERLQDEVKSDYHVFISYR